MSDWDSQTLKKLLFEASELSRTERDAYLVSNASGALLAEARRLLSALDSAGDFILTSWTQEVDDLESEILPKIGEIVNGRYRLERHLKDGGSSRVFLAADLRLSRNAVVIKVIRHISGDFSQWRELLDNEIRTLAKIHHSGVSGLIDVGELPTGHPYLVTRYVPGTSLRELIAGGKLSRRLALRLLETVADILDNVHRDGVVHLDLKPENVIVEEFQTARPVVTVVDFGIAQTRTAGEKDVTGGGTPLYTAPEAFGQQGTTASDVYSLGRIAAEILPPRTAIQRKAIEAAVSEDAEKRLPSTRALVAELSKGERGPRWPALAVATLAGMAVLIAAAAALISRASQQAPLTVRPITSMKGVEDRPAFSPNGDFLVFSFEDPSEQVSIWRLDLASAMATQLTDGLSVDDIPLVSADGAEIYFYRRTPSRSIHIMKMAASGGAAKVVHTGDVQSFCLGPDQRLIYIGQWDSHHRSCSLYRLNATSGELRPLREGPTALGGTFDVACAPSGKALAYVRGKSTRSGDVFVQDLDESGMPLGEERQVTRLEARFAGVSWTPDSRQVVFAAGSLTRKTLWSAPVDGSRPAKQMLVTGDSIESPRIASRAWKLAAIRGREDSDVWKAVLKEPGGDLESFEPLFKSSSLDEEGVFSPTDGRIAFLSERSHWLQAWVANSAASKPKAVTSFERTEKAWLNWASPGDLLMYVELPNKGGAVYRLGVDGKGGNSPERVFTPGDKQRVVGIAYGGEAIYVNRFDTEPPTLERRFLNGRATEAIGTGLFGFVKEDPHRERIYFARDQQKLALWEMPYAGGTPRRVVEELHRRNSFAVADGWLYYVALKPKPGLYALNLKSGKSRLLRLLDRPPGWGLSVSRNGRELLLTLYDMQDTDIVLIENLR